MKRSFCSVLIIVLLLPISLFGLNKTNSKVKIVQPTKEKLVQLPASKSGIPTEINYQGWVCTATDTTGLTGKYNMIFRLYDTPTGLTPLWSEAQDSVIINKGVFSVLLGSVTTIPDTIFNGTYLYLETQVESEVLSPRKKIVSVGYAIKSKNADNSINADTANYARNANVDYVDSSGHSLYTDSTAKSVYSWDSDKLDGKHSTDFLSSTGDTKTGNYLINGVLTIDSTTDTGHIVIRDFGTGGGAGTIAPNINSYLFRADGAINLGVNSNFNLASQLWSRDDITKRASLLELGSAGISMYVANSGTNPINWTKGFQMQKESETVMYNRLYLPTIFRNAQDDVSSNSRITLTAQATSGTNTTFGIGKIVYIPDTANKRGSIAFYSYDGGTDYNEVMRIDSSKKVGILDSIPSKTLSVKGQGKFTDTLWGKNIVDSGNIFTSGNATADTFIGHHKGLTDSSKNSTYADTAKFAMPIRIDFRPTGATSFTDVFNLGGLLLQARCIYSMGYDLEVNVRTTVNNSTVHFTYTFGSSLWGGTTQEGVQDEDFDTADTLSLLNVGAAGYYDVQGMLVYSSPTGANITIIFQAHDERGGTYPLGGTVKCLFTGTAFYSPAP